MSVASLKQILGGRNLYLIGMMGSGKTVTGPLLANKIGYGFVDSDEVIEKLVNKPINEIFNEDGENTFRELETKVLQETGKHYELVVSTGGGVVLKTKNWGILHQGIVIWLDPSRELLWERLKSDTRTRPLIRSKDPLSSLDQIIKDRYLFYKEADLRIGVGNESPEELAELIVKKLPSIISPLKDQGEPHTIGY